MLVRLLDILMALSLQVTHGGRTPGLSPQTLGDNGLIFSAAWKASVCATAPPIENPKMLEQCNSHRPRRVPHSQIPHFPAQSHSWPRAFPQPAI